VTNQNRLLVTSLQVGFAIPNDDHREMRTIYTRWVHDADCQHLADFTVQGTKLTWKLLDNMGKKLLRQINIQSSEANDVLKALPKDTPDELAVSLREANDQRLKDCQRFNELQDGYRRTMREHEKAIASFTKMLSRGGV